MDMELEANNSACYSSGDGNSGRIYVGFICAGVAVVFFGSNFVPVKKFETGDGKDCFSSLNVKKIKIMQFYRIYI